MAELYVKSLSGGKNVWMGLGDGKLDIKPKIEVNDEQRHQSPMDNAHQTSIQLSNAPISRPLDSALVVGFPLTTSSPVLPTSSTVSVMAEGQATMDEGNAVVDKEKTVANAYSVLQKLREMELAKERESQLKDQLLESKDALIAMWKEKYGQLEKKVKEMEEDAAKITEKRDAMTMESAVQTETIGKNANETAEQEQRSRAAIAAQKLGLPLDVLEPPNEWKQKCEELERALENLRNEFYDDQNWKTKYNTAKRLMRAEQKITAALREELMEMRTDLVEPIQLNDVEMNEMVTSPLDPVQLEGQKRRQRKEQLMVVREENATTVNGDAESLASGEQQEESDGNVAVTAEERMTTAEGESGSRRISVNTSFPCTKCPQQLHFASALQLQQHQQRRHSARHRHQCDQCQQSFTQKNNLNTHKKAVHDGQKPFPCPVCHKSFAQKVNLKAHERTHTGERPSVCAVCQKTFVTSSDLRKHERAHTGEMQYCCRYCGKKFTRSSVCCTHQKTCAQQRTIEPFLP